MATPSKPSKRATKKAATVAHKAEAGGDGFATVEQCGLTLRIPLGDNVPLDLIEAASELDIDGETEADKRRRGIALTKALLGPEQWEAFRAARPTWGDYLELGAKIGELSGN